MISNNRLVARLSSLRARGRRALAPYVTAGDGGLATTLAVLRALDREHVACVELGLPFSDPIADGPVLQAAAQRALDTGTTFARVLAMLEDLRRGDGAHAPSELPIAILSYANPLVRRGWDESVSALAVAGADALLVADLPVEEGAAMAHAARTAGLAPIFFVAPTTSAVRMRAAIAASEGFVYAIGRLGVTGAATNLDESAQDFLARVRAQAGDLSVAVGFGIATAEGVAAATRHADLAIVGSALVEHVHRAASTEPSRHAAAAAEAAGTFIDRLARGIAP